MHKQNKKLKSDILITKQKTQRNQTSPPKKLQYYLDELLGHNGRCGSIFKKKKIGQKF